MSPQTSFAELVKARREALSMTQSVLADAAGVTERTVQRVEKGESPSPETVMALCSVLGISQTTAHSAMRQAPPTRPSERSSNYGEAFIALTPAHGPRAEGERSLALIKLVRSQEPFQAIAAPDLTALARTLVTDDMLARQGLSWSDGGCEEHVIETATARSIDNPLRNLVARMRSFNGERSGALLILFVLTSGFLAAAAIVIKHYFGDVIGNAFLIGASLAWIVAMLAWLPETDLEKAQSELGEDWVVGIGRDRFAISKTGTREVDVVLARDIAECSLRRWGRHLTWSYMTFDGRDHRMAFLPDLPEIRAAFGQIEAAVRDLDTRTTSTLSPQIA